MSSVIITAFTLGYLISLVLDRKHYRNSTEQSAKVFYILINIAIVVFFLCIFYGISIPMPTHYLIYTLGLWVKNIVEALAKLF